MKRNDKPLISIIVPIYNTGLYLQNCIESLINQSYENIEIILVNDGSTDNSKQICDDYEEKDSRIKVIHKKNEGVSRARNTGIHHSSGEYLCFVDGDDFVMQDYVEYLYELIGVESEISLTTDMFGNFSKNQVAEEIKELWTPEKAVESILCYRVPIGCYCKMFKRDFLLKNNLLFSSDIFIGEGFNFNVDCFQRANSIIRGNRKVYYYRRDNELSATTKFSEEKWANGIYALDYMNERFIISSEKIRRAWEYAKWRTYSDAYDAMVLSGEINYKSELYMECNSNIKLGFWKSLKVPVSLQDKIRAFVLMVCPRIIPVAMKIRKMVYIRK